MAAADAPLIEGDKDTVMDGSLRHVEKDILISKMIRQKAHEVCFEPYVRGKLTAGIVLDMYDIG